MWKSTPYIHECTSSLEIWDNSTPGFDGWDCLSLFSLQILQNFIVQCNRCSCFSEWGWQILPKPFFFNYFLVLFCNRKHPRNIMFGEECILADYFVASCLRFRFAFAHAGMHSLPNTVYCIIGDTWILPNAPLEHVCVRGWNHQFFLGSLLCKTKKRKKKSLGAICKKFIKFLQHLRGFFLWQLLLPCTPHLS